MSWDPDQYERYKTYRDRPALDLMLQIPQTLEPGEIWDLGCGTGEHAVLLARRHPLARTHGLDSSTAMLAKAKARAEDVDWVLGDAGTWAPERPADLIFSNAALHWLGDHERLFPRIMQQLAPGGVFACQMPVSYQAPQHVLMRETAADGPWAQRLAAVDGVKPLGRSEDYYDWLSPLSRELDVWTTTYLHVLSGEDPVVDWMLGTGLRPYVEALSEPERPAFLQAYRARVSQAFPRRTDGTTPLPFERLFLVAVRS